MSPLDKFLNAFKPMATVIAITFALALLSHAFPAGAFSGVSTLEELFYLSMLISGVAYFFFLVCNIPVCIFLNYSTPGLILATVFGLIGGTISLELVSYFVPNLVLFSSWLKALSFALADTLLVWVLAYLTGSFNRTTTFKPVKRERAN